MQNRAYNGQGQRETQRCGHDEHRATVVRTPASNGCIFGGGPQVHPEFAIRQFESLHPSHTVLLFWRVGRPCRKVPTFRALAHSDLVSAAS